MLLELRGWDSQAFRELALAEMDAVCRMAFHLARKPDDAADLMQETYLRALKAEGTFELRDKGITPWLFKILHNVFYTKVGKRKREPRSMDDRSHEADHASALGDGPDRDLQKMVREDREEG